MEDGEAGIAEDIGAEIGEGIREPKRVRNPLLPNSAEMELHMLTHVPFSGRGSSFKFSARMNVGGVRVGRTTGKDGVGGTQRHFPRVRWGGLVPRGGKDYGHPHARIQSPPAAPPASKAARGGLHGP